MNHSEVHKPRPEKIIGGMFGLESSPNCADLQGESTPAFLSKPYIKLASARSAFRLLELFLSPETVWLPSYLCGVVLDTFQSARVRFYPVDGRLQVGSDEWLSAIVPDDMVVFIDYFGFCTWSEWGAEVRQRGAWVVEDACQAMLNASWCRHSQYVVFSPRKFVGVPDGGILMAQGENGLPADELPSPPAAWWLEALTATQLRAEFDKHGGERQWFELFQKTDTSAPIEPARMSELSALLLTHTIDFEVIAQSRRENYSLFASALPELAVFPELPSDVVPLGFPIRVADREHLRQALFEALVFPPVHWHLEGIVPYEFAESHALSKEIMTLPCDQRMCGRDVDRVVRLLRNAALERKR